MPQPTKSSPKKQPNPSHHKLIVILIAFAVILPLGYYLYNHSFLSPRNYAQEVAQPLEDALIKAGGIKKCSEGDNGRTIDNREPWYQVYFEMAGNPEAATEKIKSTLQEASLNLVDDASSNAPQDIKHYLDETSKQSPYGDLHNGKVRYIVTIYSDDSLGYCSNIPTNTTNTTFKLTVKLPSFK